MRGRSIQKSDGSREEAVLELVGTRSQTFVSFSRRKKVVESTSRMCGVPDYAGCFSETAESVEESMDGRLVCVMDWALFTTLCSFLRFWSEQETYQAVVQPERMFSMVHL